MFWYSVRVRAGFTLSRALLGKKCGARHLGRQTLFFSGKNWRPFLVITVRVTAVSSPEKLATFFWSSLSLLFISPVHSGVAHYFPHAKNVPLLLWAPLFVGPLLGRTCWTCLNPSLVRVFCWLMTCALGIFSVLDNFCHIAHLHSNAGCERQEYFT